MLADASEDLLAFTSFPQVHWRKVWSTNPLERLSGEIKRRTNVVVGIFPNDTVIARLVTAVIVEAHDEWASPSGATYPKNPWPRSAPPRPRSPATKHSPSLRDKLDPTPTITAKPNYTTPGGAIRPSSGSRRRR